MLSLDFLKSLVIFAFVLIPTAEAQSSSDNRIQFDLAQVPGTYVVSMPTMKIQIRIDRPDVLKKVLEQTNVTSVAPLQDVQEDWDSSPNAPGFDTDDGVTGGPNVVEVDVTTNCNERLNDKTCVIDEIFNYGIGSHVQLFVQKMLTHDLPAGQPSMTLVSDTLLGAKVNVFQKSGLAVAVAPVVSLRDGVPPTGNGHVIFFPILVSKQVGHRSSVSFNVGATRSIENPQVRTTSVSLAVGHALSDTSKIAVEVANVRTPTESIYSARIGWAKVVFKKTSSPYQIQLIPSLLRTFGSTPEGRPRYAARISLVITRRPPNQN